MTKKKMVMVGIAGSTTDFLLSIHALKCFVYQKEEIKNNIDITLKQYYYIPLDEVDEKSQYIFNDIEKEEPDIVGFSCYVWNIDAVRTISDKLKQKNKDIQIILGGPEIAREDIIAGKFSDFSADFLFFGEGERPLLKFLERILGISDHNLDEIKGFAHRNGNSFSCHSQLDFVEKLEELPSPYLTGFVSDELLSRENMRVNIETQRGCNFRCAYCFYHKGFPSIRYRNPKIVVDEIEYAYNKGIKMGRILDANFLSDREFAKGIIRELINRKIKMALFFEMIPIFLDDETANLFGEFSRLSENNMLMTGIGIQTLTQESLAVIRRQIHKKWFEKAFNLLQAQGVIIKSDIILGLPRETKESYLKTLEFITEKMRHGTNYLSLALLRVLPGTDLVDIAKKEKLVIDNRDSLHFVYSTPEMPRSDMVYCLRLNTVAFRLLSSVNIEERMKLRDLYFTVKDKLGATNIDMLEYFVKEFLEYLKPKKTNFVDPDFPNAEYYSFKTVYQDVSDGWLIEKLEGLKNTGLYTKT